MGKLLEQEAPYSLKINSEGVLGGDRLSKVPLEESFPIAE